MCYVTVTNIFISQPYLFFHIYDHLYVRDIFLGIAFFMYVQMCIHTDRKYINNHRCLPTCISTYMSTYMILVYVHTFIFVHKYTFTLTCTSMYICVMGMLGDFGGHNKVMIYLKSANSAPNGSNHCLSDTRFDECRVTSHTATQRY